MRLYMSQGEVSRSARQWAWANRPLESLDNPVKRYLRNRQIWKGLKRPYRSRAARKGWKIAWSGG